MRVSLWLATLWGVAAVLIALALVAGGPDRPGAGPPTGGIDPPAPVPDRRDGIPPGAGPGVPPPGAVREPAPATDAGMVPAEPPPPWVGVMEGTGDGGRPRGGLPEDGDALLASGLPLVDDVATILKEAQVNPGVLRGHLRAVVGHVQRLEVFKTMAGNDARRLRDLDAANAAPGAESDAPGPALEFIRFIAENSARELAEYEEYVRRSLERDLGITDDAVFRRIADLARETPTPPGGGAQGVNRGENP